jgi:DNA polymerase III subunit delta'
MNNISENKLYGLDKYILQIINLFEKNKLPNKILLSGNKGIGKSTLAYHLINFIFSINEEHKYDLKNLTYNLNNKSYKLISNYSHPNFFLIDIKEDKKNIDINQIRQMITFSNKSSFNSKPRFVLIDNIEHLNKNSVNALLKIIEEPTDNLFFILIHNNRKNILATLSSRCITFKINLSFDETIKITNSILKENLFELINTDLINYYNSPGDFIRLINFAKHKKINLKDFTLTSLLFYLLDNTFYKKDNEVKNFIIDYMELYLFSLYKLNNNKKDILTIYNYFSKKIDNINKFNLDYESLFIEFKSKVLNG